MAASAAELDRIADYITAVNMTMRIHSGDPGANGTSNRIGNSDIAMASTNWSASSGGVSTYNDSIEFGVLSATGSTSVSHYSLWRGGTFAFRNSFLSPQTIPQNGEMAVVSGTLSIDVADM